MLLEQEMQGREGEGDPEESAGSRSKVVLQTMLRRLYFILRQWGAIEGV